MFIHIPTAPWPLEAPTLIYLLPHNSICRHLHSHDKCPPLASVGTCTHMPVGLFYTLQSPALSCPMTLLPLQAHILMPTALDGLCTHLHSWTHCTFQPSCYNCTHIPNARLFCAGICTKVSTAHLWSCCVATHTCPLPSWHL